MKRKLKPTAAIDGEYIMLRLPRLYADSLTDAAFCEVYKYRENGWGLQAHPRRCRRIMILLDKALGEMEEREKR